MPRYGIRLSTLVKNRYAKASTSHLKGETRNSRQPSASQRAPRAALTIRACISVDPGSFPASAELQNFFEMFRVVRVHQHPGPRQVEVIQAREPEAQRRGAQHRRPGLALERIERPHRVARSEKRARTRFVEAAVGRG